jgi:hypothetical protein
MNALVKLVPINSNSVLFSNSELWLQGGLYQNNGCIEIHSIAVHLTFLINDNSIVDVDEYSTVFVEIDIDAYRILYDSSPPPKKKIFICL